MPITDNRRSKHEEAGAPEDKRNIKTSELQDKTCFEVFSTILSYILVIIFFPIALFFCFTQVREYERMIVFRMGRLKPGGAKGPGLIFYLPCIDDIILVDLRTTSLDVDPQEILTKDSVTLYVDAVVFYHMNDPLKAVIQVENYRQSTQFLGQTTLRNVAGTKMMSELLIQKEAVARQIETILDEATDPWGIKVERVEIKNVLLPVSLQRAMTAEAEAQRGARAKVVAAEGELSSAKALKEASDAMSSNAITLQLRYLQTMNSIASEKNSTIVFPFPIDFIVSK